MSNRRQFLQLAGAGAAATLISTTALSAQQTEEDTTSHTPLHDIKLGLASYTTRKLSLEETLEAVGRLGLRYLCLKSFHLPLDDGAEKIAKVAAKIRATGVDLYGCGVISMREPAHVDQAFEYAKAGGMRIIVAMPSTNLLPLINKKVQQYDICLAIHNHGPTDNYFPTPEVAYEKIRHLDPRVGLCIDIGHTVRSGVNPSQSARKCADRLLDVHIKDVSAASVEGQCVEAGHGVIDLPEFLRTLVDIRYSGVVSFEHEKDPDRPLLGLAESVGYVRGILATI